MYLFKLAHTCTNIESILQVFRYYCMLSTFLMLMCWMRQRIWLDNFQGKEEEGQTGSHSEPSSQWWDIEWWWDDRQHAGQVQDRERWGKDQAVCAVATLYRYWPGRSWNITFRWIRNLQNNKIQRNKFGIHKFDHANMFTMLLQNFLPNIGLQISYLLEILINMWQLCI